MAAPFRLGIRTGVDRALMVVLRDPVELSELLTPPSNNFLTLVVQKWGLKRSRGWRGNSVI